MKRCGGTQEAVLSSSTFTVAVLRKRTQACVHIHTHTHTQIRAACRKYIDSLVKWVPFIVCQSDSEGTTTGRSDAYALAAN